MRTIRVVAGLLVAALPACERGSDAEIEPPAVGEALPSLPIPPQSQIMSRQGSTDALQLTLHSALPPDQAVAFYRGILLTPEWRLVSDTRDSSGVVTLYAEGKRPLWVRVGADTAGSLITLTGAVPGADTAYARKLKAAAETTNTMRPR